MNNCKESAISYTPIYFNLMLTLFYIIIQYFKNKHHTKNLDHIKKEISSSQSFEKRYSNDMNNIKNVILEIIKEESDIEKNIK
jgi:hypothetical protein